MSLKKQSSYASPLERLPEKPTGPPEVSSPGVSASAGRARHSALRTKGQVKRGGMVVWSPIGDSPFWNRLPKGHQSVTRSSLVMSPTPFSPYPFRFDPRCGPPLRRDCRRLASHEASLAEVILGWPCQPSLAHLGYAFRPSFGALAAAAFTDGMGTPTPTRGLQ